MTTLSRQHLLQEIERLPQVRTIGRVVAVKGLLIECSGIEEMLSVGARCAVHGTLSDDHEVLCEVVGFREKVALLMPFGSVEGVGLGAKVSLVAAQSAVEPSAAWLGRVIDPMGNPIDGKGPLMRGGVPYLLRADPLAASQRARVGAKMDMGVRAINTFLTTCRGQRLGIFSGSGVGKSILMSMLARYSQADVNVIGLVGERGREVKEFIEQILGEDGMARAVVVATPADNPPLMRMHGAAMATSIAEYFRDTGRHVLLLMDSLTRYAQANREIALTIGEPPATRGFPPSVFARLPQLVERAGMGVGGHGSITAFYTVLTEADDPNDPVADSARAILDGHIVLSRRLAERGLYPAIDIESSISRVMSQVVGDRQIKYARALKHFYSLYEQNADLFNVGAYQRGANLELDSAVAMRPQILEFLRQDRRAAVNFSDAVTALAQVTGGDVIDAEAT